MRWEGRWEREGEVGGEVGGTLQGGNVFVFANSRIVLRVRIFCMRYCLKLVTHAHAHMQLPTTPVTLLTQSSVCRVDDSHITHIKINNVVRFQPDPHHCIQIKILGNNAIP